ncbi:hypothetical protein PV08_02112 [Exophiala spinifera]|uniref:Uncharacterized protein n=1 Tax=Exophiala spinifera TaxID=91928 RepID=A0A0D2A9W9_9EURO|nr:uncharacterized protein PV08_02112 [Exophiala spinifera]KIW21532.1 hypothetical protein PV08_02112 [Exophiala spinifera]
MAEKHVTITKLFETFTVEQIANILALSLLFQYLIRLEQLVDGMTTAQQWCKETLFDESQAQHVLDLENSKKDKVDHS